MFKGLRFFLSEGWKYEKRYVLWLILGELTAALIPITASLMPKFIIDELTGSRRIEKLILYVAVFAGYAFAAGALRSYFQLDGFTRRCLVNEKFDLRLNRQLTEIDYECLESPAFQDMRKKAEKFLYCDWHGFGYLLDCAVRIIGQAAALIGLAAILARLDPWFVLLFVALALVGAQLESRAKKKATALSMSVVNAQRGMIYFGRVFGEARFAKEIRLSASGGWLLERFRNYYDKNLACIKQQNALFIRSGVLNSALSFIRQAAAYAFLIHNVLAGAMSVGDFTMCVTAVTAFAEAMRQIMDSVTEIRVYDMYYENLDEFLNMPRRMRGGKAIPAPGGKHELEFRNVGFRYPGAEKWALRGINLTLRPGEKLSLVGENGSGKTTLIKLMCRMYDPTEGAVLLDGRDIRDIDHGCYMRLFSTVFQDYQLFDFSLRDNIALGMPSDDAHIADICRRVGLGGLLDKLPNGLDTYIGREFDEQGFLPSGGESQKIALARALFKKAPVIVLDEPTAALDPKAEYELYRAFDALTDRRTAVYISHRMSSSRFCDRIAVLHEGKMAEYGSHEELMARKGVYARLYAMQAQYYTDRPAQ